MEPKYNDATSNRPGGERPVDAPIILADLEAIIRQLKSEPAWQQSDRNAITISHNAALRLVLVALHEGAELSRKMSAAASVQIIEGRVWLEGEEESYSMDPPAVATLQAGTPYHIFAETDSVLLLTLAGSGDGDDLNAGKP